MQPRERPEAPLRTGVSSSVHPEWGLGATFEQSQTELVDTLAGYRLVRRLARGSRSTVFLAQAESLTGIFETDGAPGTGSDRIAASGVGSVALKVFAHGTARGSLDAEVAALSAVRHPHIVSLTDIATGPDGLPVLIMNRVNGPTLARILGSATMLRRGEATTVLAPICSALQALHDNGFSHGHISSGKVVLDADGSPILLGLGRARARKARSLADVGWRESVLGDQRSLLNLCLSACGELDFRDTPDRTQIGPSNAESARVHGLLEAQRELQARLGNGASDSFLPLLESWLFKQGTPLPLRSEEFGLSNDNEESLRSRPGPLIGEFPSRRQLPNAAHSEWPEPDGQSTEDSPPKTAATLASLLRMLPLPEWVQMAAAERSRRRRKAGLRRRPVIVSMVGTVVLMMAALVLIPGGEGDDIGAELGSESDVSLGLAPEIQTGASGEADQESNDQAAAILGDDPAAALAALSARRNRCLTAKSVDCLSGVNQWQSAAGSADGALLAGVPAGEPAHFVPFDTRSLSTVQRSGNSAIVAAAGSSDMTQGQVVVNDEPASFLLMKGEAGWRLRDVFFR
jgi:serine/threonine protein kinase